MSSKSTKIGAAVLVATCVAGAVWYQSRSEPSVASPHGGSQNIESADYRPLPWREGDEHSYELEMDTKTVAGGGTLISYGLSGTWIIRVTGVRGSRIDFEARVLDAEFDAQGQAVGSDAQVRLDAAKAQFAMPFAFSMDDRGVLHTVADSTNTEVQVRSFSRNLASLMQVVQETDEDVWQVDERDNAGVYSAAYRRVSDTRLEKKKVKYVELGDAAKDSKHRLVVEKSKMDIVLRPEDGLPMEINGSERIKAEGDTLGGTATETKVRLTFLGTERPTRPVADLSANRVSPPNVYLRQGSYSPETDLARIGNRQFTDTIQDLVEVLAVPNPKSEADKRRERRAFIALAAMFRQRPKDVETALDMLKAGETLNGALWDALGSSGSPAAQAALVTSIQMSKWTPNERSRQMIALSFAERPTEETVSFLQGMANDPEQHQQARYGLGTAAYRLAKEEPMRAAEIVDDLQDRLAATAVPRDQRELVTGLGNSGHPSAAPVILEKLDSDSTVMRIEALDALRMMPGSQISEAIAGRITGDQDASVRVAAVDTARERTPDEPLARALLSAWTQDPDEGVRKSAGAAIDWIESRHPGFRDRMNEARASL